MLLRGDRYVFKVVIIDDEPIIIKGLSAFIPWEKYDCEIVGTADNGLQGLELIREKKPDIIFSDIYMPKMNGLAMAAAIKSEFEHVEITLVTGYRDFDLLQEALHIGVARYILKPSKMEELEEALKTMTDRLKKHEQISEEQESDSTAGSFIVNHALEYMKQHYQQKLSLKDVADHVFVSQWHLSKLLNKHKEQGFLEILNEIRIEEAKKLLRDPSLRIGDIASLVGFSDLPHFSRVFKKITGVSANEYRNQ